MSSMSSMSMSPPPPSDLGTYSRSMHQHTKRQMEQASQLRHHDNSQPTNNGTSSQSGPSAMPNGVAGAGASSRRHRSPGDYGYQT
ncbi:hypothetical protein QBC46DRAFT_337023 [Diplogelasinospora grovesii]|uniref:Uncharacterized protein n=1 Tax=Diplogelasinospora grovesii TaxID=303347 RepID=A0AAN6NG42_9PEZI|nr:hypothetical protein QBC46DRAFT_337023 [Diplogelasinospora grovesii]